MDLTLVIESPIIEHELREEIVQRMQRSLSRFGHRLTHLRAVLADEHGRHGAPRYRCRLEAELDDGERLVVTGHHQHPLGSTAAAVHGLRRKLAERAAGLDARDRRHGRVRRGKRRAA